jgi:lycopene beta-cyclase
MKTEYLLVLSGILAFPLLLSLLMPLRLYRHWRAMLLSIACVCLIYWAWDVTAIERGHWSFNPSYVLGNSLFGMPVEEWLFFPVIGFVSLFTYEAVRFVLERRGQR